MLLLCMQVQAKVYMVAVGIADYPGKANDLKRCADDARLIASLYQKNDSLSGIMLLDSDATKSNILNSIRQVFAEAGVDDIVVFFYSGHGYRGGFVAYDNKITYGEVRDAMKVTRCKNKMMFSDACYAGKIRSDRRSQQSNEKVDKNAKVMFFLGSRSDELSQEKRYMKNGLFTTYLYRALKGGADANRDRIITAKELFKYVHSYVSKVSGGKQHPVMWGKFPDDMPVMKW